MEQSGVTFRLRERYERCTVTIDVSFLGMLQAHKGMKRVHKSNPFTVHTPNLLKRNVKVTEVVRIGGIIISQDLHIV